MLPSPPVAAFFPTLPFYPNALLRNLPFCRLLPRTVVSFSGSSTPFCLYRCCRFVFHYPQHCWDGTCTFLLTLVPFGTRRHLAGCRLPGSPTMPAFYYYILLCLGYSPRLPLLPACNPTFAAHTITIPDYDLVSYTLLAYCLFFYALPGLPCPLPPIYPTYTCLRFPGLTFWFLWTRALPTYCVLPYAPSRLWWLMVHTVLRCYGAWTLRVIPCHSLPALPTERSGLLHTTTFACPALRLCTFVRWTPFFCPLYLPTGTCPLPCLPVLVTLPGC